MSPREGNGDLQTLICVLVARPRRCLTSSNPVPWQNWMAAYLSYTLRMKMLFRGWPIMVHDMHKRRRIRRRHVLVLLLLYDRQTDSGYSSRNTDRRCHDDLSSFFTRFRLFIQTSTAIRTDHVDVVHLPKLLCLVIYLSIMQTDTVYVSVYSHDHLHLHC